MKYFYLLSCLAAAMLLGVASRAGEFAPATAPVFRFSQNTSAVVGRHIQIYANSQKNLPPHQELVADFQINGSAVPTKQVSPSLWLLNVGLINEVKVSNLVTANIFTRDLREKARLQREIKRNDEFISAIEAALASETDPEKIAELQAQLAEKQRLRLELQTALANLPVFLQSESYTYTSVADPANPNYPFASTVSPASGVASGGTLIQIFGDHFPTTGVDPIVKVGNAECALSSRSATLIEATTPTGMSLGLMDVEIIFPGNPRKNALLTNAFTVITP